MPNEIITANQELFGVEPRWTLQSSHPFLDPTCFEPATTGWLADAVLHGQSRLYFALQKDFKVWRYSDGKMKGFVPFSISAEGG